MRALAVLTNILIFKELGKYRVKHQNQLNHDSTPKPHNLA